MQDNFHSVSVDDRCGIRSVDESVHPLGPDCDANVLHPVGPHRALAEDQPVACPCHRDVQHARRLGLFLVLDRRAICVDQRIGEPIITSADRIADEQPVVGSHHDTLVVGMRPASQVRHDHYRELESLGLMDRHQAHDVVAFACDLRLRLARRLLHQAAQMAREIAESEEAMRFEFARGLH